MRLAEDAWNTRDLARVALYTTDSRWRNRSEFLQGRAAIEALLARKWSRECRTASVRANGHVKSLVFGGLGPVRTARSSLIQRKASLMSGFNSLLGPNYFPVPLRREFDCKFLSLLVLSMVNSDVGSQNRWNSLYFPC